MSNIFSSVINVSISASLLILAVAVYRLIFRKAPKWINCVLWGMVALRLVIPVKISTVFGTVPNFRVFNMGETLQQTYISSGNYAIDDAVNGLKETYEVNKLIPNDMDLLPMIWIIGMMVMLIFAVISYLNIVVKTRASIKSDDGYFVCDDISTPFILGFISPKIYIPSGIDKAFLNGVIAHEKTHIRRRDYIWKLLGYLILTVYWFNPAVWAAYILLSRDIEYACDEKVVKRMSREEIADYSRALLNCCSSRRIISFCPVAFGNVGVKQRIKSVFNYKKPSFWIILIALAASVSLILVFATNRKENVEPDVLKPDESKVYINENDEEEFGYYRCWYNPDFKGAVGIAEKNEDGTLNVLIKPQYYSIQIFSGNRFVTKKYKNYQYYSSMIDASGKEIVSEFLGNIYRIGGTDDEAIYCVYGVKSVGLCYFVDANGNRINNELFTSADCLINDVFYAKNKSGYSFFGADGKLAGKAKVGEKAVLKVFDFGLSLVIECSENAYDFKYGVQNEKGETIVPCEYSMILVFPNKRISAYKGDNLGLEPTDVADLFDLSGNKLTNGEYSYIYFDGTSEYGIATKMRDDFSKFSVIIDSYGNEKSERYAEIRNEKGAYFGNNGGPEKKIYLE